MKSLIITIVLSVIISTAAIAQETSYVGHAKNAVLQELQKFYGIEVGNRVTEYNFSTLIGRIGDLFTKFERAEQDSIRDAKKKKAEKDTPTDIHK